MMHLSLVKKMKLVLIIIVRKVDVKLIRNALMIGNFVCKENVEIDAWRWDVLGDVNLEHVTISKIQSEHVSEELMIKINVILKWIIVMGGLVSMIVIDIDVCHIKDVFPGEYVMLKNDSKYNPQYFNIFNQILNGNQEYLRRRFSIKKIFIN